uniref:Ig-like domain-containing protein n=1 Tax=Mus spicilegus TaxID=10103 RepID=A0A8C6HBV4_MUSSI
MREAQRASKCDSIAGDAKTTQPDSMESTEGETVHLPCSHATISGNEYIYWYREVPLQGPEYVTHGLQQNTTNSMAFLAIASDRKSSTLILPHVSLRDAAVYHLEGWTYLHGDRYHNF